MKKPKLRTPDGKIQMRSIDDLLKEVASDASVTHLPGKGKPLDLRSYFAPGEEYRVAGKILQENKVLPPHLQERKDAEEHQEKARILLSEAQEQIPQLRNAVLQKIDAFISPFPNRETCQNCLGLPHWPNDYPTPKATPITQKEHLKIADATAQEIARYNARINNLIYRYLTHLNKAQENIQNYHKRQLLNSTLSPTYNYLAPIDVAQKETEIKALFPLLHEYPPNLSTLLKNWHRTKRPTLWKRITHRA